MPENRDCRKGGFHAILVPRLQIGAGPTAKTPIRAHRVPKVSIMIGSFAPSVETLRHLNALRALLVRHPVQDTVDNRETMLQFLSIWGSYLPASSGFSPVTRDTPDYADFPDFGKNQPAIAVGSVTTPSKKMAKDFEKSVGHPPLFGYSIVIHGDEKKGRGGITVRLDFSGEDSILFSYCNRGETKDSLLALYDEAVKDAPGSHGFDRLLGLV